MARKANRRPSARQARAGRRAATFQHAFREEAGAVRVPRDVRELLQRPITPELYGRVLQEWKTHSIAEDRRDIPGLISTLTPDCVYEIPQMERRWEGHDGARQFYTELLGAFPDIRFDLTDIVVGPQGVWEEAVVSGTFQRDWLDVPATKKRIEFRVSIFFPWDLARGKFTGERVFVDGAALTRPETQGRSP